MAGQDRWDRAGISFTDIAGLRRSQDRLIALKIGRNTIKRVLLENGMDPGAGVGHGGRHPVINTKSVRLGLFLGLAENPHNSAGHGDRTHLQKRVGYPKQLLAFQHIGAVETAEPELAVELGQGRDAQIGR